MIYGIVAVCKNQGIGYQGHMPWPFLKNDLEFFKKQTLNNIVVMGAKTWYSLPKQPLPDRVNLVISKSLPESDRVFRSPEPALDYCKINFPEKKIFIIGGQEIYNSCRDFINTFYVTEINAVYDCDRFFDLEHIKENYKNTNIISEFQEPVKYKITEYTK